MARNLFLKAALLALMLNGFAGAAVAARFTLSYVPIVSWFPDQPRHTRASSIASGQTTPCTSEKLDDKGDGFRLILRTTSFANEADTAAAFTDALASTKTPGATVASFANGGLQGTEVSVTDAAGHHTRTRLMTYGVQLIQATASWNDDTELPTVTHFLSSVRLRA